MLVRQNLFCFESNNLKGIRGSCEMLWYFSCVHRYVAINEHSSSVGVKTERTLSSVHGFVFGSLMLSYVPSLEVIYVEDNARWGVWLGRHIC